MMDTSDPDGRSNPVTRSVGPGRAFTGLVLLVVFASYFFAQLLPLAYPRLLAYMASSDVGAVFRVLEKSVEDATKELSSAKELEQKKIIDMQAASMRHMSLISETTRRRELRESGTNTIRPACDEGTGNPPLNCASNERLQEMLVEAEFVRGRTQAELNEAKDRSGQLLADLNLIRQIGRLNVQNDVRSIGLMVVAAAAGLLGAFLRYLTTAPADLDLSPVSTAVANARDYQRRAGLLIGPLLGVAVFWLLESKFLIPLLYTGAVDIQGIQQAEVTLHGTAIFAALAGLVGYEVLGRVRRQVTNERSTVEPRAAE